MESGLKRLARAALWGGALGGGAGGGGTGGPPEGGGEPEDEEAEWLDSAFAGGCVTGRCRGLAKRRFSSRAGSSAYLSEFCRRRRNAEILHFYVKSGREEGRLQLNLFDII